MNEIPELRCTVCRSELSETDYELICMKCTMRYPIQNGIPHMLDASTMALAEEIAVQDKAALEYENKRYKDEYALRYHDWWTDAMLHGLNSGGSVLDNGCGIGILSRHIRCSHLVGLDISAEMLARAQNVMPRVVHGNSMMLPFATASFDGVFCRSLLHHLRRPEKAVSETARVLKTGGWITLAETNASLLSWLPRFIAKKGEHFSDDHQNLNKNRLSALFEKNFEITRCSFFGYIAYPLFGFPDLLPPLTCLPMRRPLYALLMKLDALLSKIPVLRTQSWGIFIQARRR
jgi:ubiquinone/menaquinone biosynthesis C-methylase UbiE